MTLPPESVQQNILMDIRNLEQMLAILKDVSDTSSSDLSMLYKMIGSEIAIRKYLFDRNARRIERHNHTIASQE